MTRKYTYFINSNLLIIIYIVLLLTILVIKEFLIISVKLNAKRK